MTQRIDVSNLASSIDGGNIDFVLSAWLGGFSSQNDIATVIAHFMNSSNVEIGTAQLPAVTAANRGNVTGLLLREQLGDVPAFTRSINIESTATRSTGENDGYTDNISLVFGFIGDLNNDMLINLADWNLFRSGQLVNMTGFTRAQALGARRFERRFSQRSRRLRAFQIGIRGCARNRSFVAMLAQVPEPSTVFLTVLCGVFLAGQAGRSVYAVEPTALHRLPAFRQRARRICQHALILELHAAQSTATGFTQEIMYRCGRCIDC